MLDHDIHLLRTATTNVNLDALKLKKPFSKELAAFENAKAAYTGQADNAVLTKQIERALLLDQTFVVQTEAWMRQVKSFKKLCGPEVGLFETLLEKLKTNLDEKVAEK
jgi:hypothetical protein